MSAFPADPARASTSRSLRLAAVVPACDGPPTLERCAAALRLGKRPPDELIVQREPAGSGPAAARNAGAQKAESDLLVFVDSDVEVHPDALERIERHFAADPTLAAVFGAYDAEPEAPGLTSRFRNLLHHHVHLSAAGPAETFWAGLGAIRRDEFETVGGFDSQRFRHPSVEDIDLGMRLRERGARLLLDPQIQGCHLKAWTPSTMVHTDFWRRGVPWVRLLLRGGRRSTALNLGPRHRASAAAAVLFALASLARRPRLALASLLALVVLNRDLYELLARRGGPRLLLAGIGLHLVHQLAAVASVPVAAGLHLRDRASAFRPRRDAAGGSDG